MENLHLTEETIKRTREAGKQHHVKVEFDLPWFKQYKKK